MTTSSIAALAARLEQLEGRNAALEAKVRDLESGTAPSAPAPTPGATPPAPVDDLAGAVGRRSLLTKGLAAAGAAAAGAVLLDGAPAAAADGNGLILGVANTARARTTLRMQAGSPAGLGHAVEILDVGANTPSQSSGLAIVARGDRFSDGADISSLNVGLRVHGTGLGMRVTSSDGTAAEVESTSGRGLKILSSKEAIDAEAYGTLVSRFTALNSGATAVIASGSAVGVNANASGTGVIATGGGTAVKATQTGSALGYGVQALATNGTGVEGYATTGAGVRGRGSTFGVIAQSLTTNPDESALAASALAGAAIIAGSDTGRVMWGHSGAGGVEIDAPHWHLRLGNSETRAAPTGDRVAHRRGDMVETTSGDLWVCVANGTPGIWRKLAGPATAGAFHILPAPARVYDSRPGLAPTAVGPKTPFGANTTRTFDLKVNASGVPAGATAVMVNLLLVNATVGNGNATIWAGGATKPVANTLVWGGDARRFSALAVTAIDTAARVQVNTSLATDLVIDVVGYYR